MEIVRASSEPQTHWFSLIGKRPASHLIGPIDFAVKDRGFESIVRRRYDEPLHYVRQVGSWTMRLTYDGRTGMEHVAVVPASGETVMTKFTAAVIADGRRSEAEDLLAVTVEDMFTMGGDPTTDPIQRFVCSGYQASSERYASRLLPADAA